MTHFLRIFHFVIKLYLLLVYPVYLFLSFISCFFRLPFPFVFCLSVCLSLSFIAFFSFSLSLPLVHQRFLHFGSPFHLSLFSLQFISSSRSSTISSFRLSLSFIACFFSLPLPFSYRSFLLFTSFIYCLFPQSVLHFIYCLLPQFISSFYYRLFLDFASLFYLSPVSSVCLSLSCIACFFILPLPFIYRLFPQFTSSFLLSPISLVYLPLPVACFFGLLLLSFIIYFFSLPLPFIYRLFQYRRDQFFEKLVFDVCICFL